MAFLGPTPKARSPKNVSTSPPSPSPSFEFPLLAALPPPNNLGHIQMIFWNFTLVTVQPQELIVFMHYLSLSTFFILLLLLLPHFLPLYGSRPPSGRVGTLHAPEIHVSEVRTEFLDFFIHKSFSFKNSSRISLNIQASNGDVSKYLPRQLRRRPSAWKYTLDEDLRNWSRKMKSLTNIEFPFAFLNLWALVLEFQGPLTLHIYTTQWTIERFKAPSIERNWVESIHKLSNVTFLSFGELKPTKKSYNGSGFIKLDQCTCP